MMVAMKEGTNDPIYFASDHLSSTSLVMDDTGLLLSHNRYMPFGEVRDITGSNDPITQTDFGYTGQRDMGGMGLMDYRARFYSPLLGRFTQPDSIVPDPLNPQNLNRYTYVINNPIMFIDPTGHLTMCELDRSLCDLPQMDEADSVIREITVIIKADRLLRKFGHGPEPNPNANDLEALAQIVETAANVYNGDWSQMLPTLTWIFNGTTQTGPLALISSITADGCAGIGRSEIDCPSNQYHFGDTGFHSDFRDLDNQIFHFWGYLAQTAAPGNPISSYIGFASGIVGNDFHEIGQSLVNYQDGWGTSWQDYVLSFQGMDLGIDISLGNISPYELGNIIRSRLGIYGNGSNGLLQYLTESFGNLRGSP